MSGCSKIEIPDPAVSLADWDLQLSGRLMQVRRLFLSCLHHHSHRKSPCKSILFATSTRLELVVSFNSGQTRLALCVASALIYTSLYTPSGRSTVYPRGTSSLLKRDEVQARHLLKNSVRVGKENVLKDPSAQLFRNLPNPRLQETETAVLHQLCLIRQSGYKLTPF